MKAFIMGQIDDTESAMPQFAIQPIAVLEQIAHDPYGLLSRLKLILAEVPCRRRLLQQLLYFIAQFWILPPDILDHARLIFDLVIEDEVECRDDLVEAIRPHRVKLPKYTAYLH